MSDEWGMAHYAAIQWQKKTVDKIEATDKANYQATLDKMLKGEPTWEPQKK